jgi:hypothetical protein
VICRNCGAEIADKALICYKCGTATTEARYQPVPLRPRRKGFGPVPVVIAIVILLLAALYLLHVFG